MKKNILITGLPRNGKSTMLSKIIMEYPNKTGFLTNEVRENSERIGFEILLHSGEKSILASTYKETPYRVSRYFVDIEALDNTIPKVLDFNSDDLLYLDEIGQMELFSPLFKDLAIRYLDATNPCIMTISAVWNDSFIGMVKIEATLLLSK